MNRVVVLFAVLLLLSVTAAIIPAQSTKPDDTKLTPAQQKAYDEAKSKADAALRAAGEARRLAGDDAAKHAEAQQMMQEAQELFMEAEIRKTGANPKRPDPKLTPAQQKDAYDQARAKADAASRAAGAAYSLAGKDATKRAKALQMMQEARALSWQAMLIKPTTVKSAEQALKTEGKTLAAADEEAKRAAMSALKEGRFDKFIDSLKHQLAVKERHHALVQASRPDEDEISAFCFALLELASQAERGGYFRLAAQWAARAAEAAEKDFPPIADATSKAIVLAKALLAQGRMLHLHGDRIASLSCLERSLAMYKKLPGSAGHPDAVTALLSMGNALEARGDPICLSYYREALEMGQQYYPKNEVALSQLRVGVGMALLRKGQVKEADALYTKALMTPVRVLDEELAAFAARHATDFGMTSREIPDKRTFFRTFQDLLEFRLHLANAKGNTDEAIDVLHKLLLIADKLDLVTRKGDYWLLLGAMYAQKGDRLRATEFAEKADKVLNRSTDIGEPFAHGDPWLAARMISLGHLYHRLGERDRARSFYEEAQSTCLRLDKGFLIGASAAEAYRSVQAARNGLWNLLDVTANGEDTAKVYGHVWHCKGLVGRGVAARQRLLALAQSAAGDAPPERRKEILRLTDDWVALRHRIGETLYTSRPDDPTALGKIRETLATLTRTAEQTERRLAALIPTFSRQRSLETLPYTKLTSRLSEKAVFVDFVRYKRLNTKQERGKEPGPGSFRYVAFVLAHGQPVRRIELGDSAAIETALHDWLRSIERKEKQPTASAETVRRLVWDKVHPCFPSGTRAVLVGPDGPLALLPWPALPCPGKPGYLVQEMAVGVVPSGVFLIDSPPARPGTESDERLLLVGDVDYGPSLAVSPPTTSVRATKGSLSFRPLDHSHDELQEIGRLYGSKVEEVTGQTATFAKVVGRLPEASHAVISTHALFANADERSHLGLDDQVFPPTDGASSGWVVGDPSWMTAIALAGANQDPAAFLTGGTIASLYLPRLRMVVLSTCQSATGQTLTNEGVFSLQRAFHQAGVPTTVGSLWNARDDGARKIIPAFHRNLHEKHLSPLEALCKAQLTYLKNAIREERGIEDRPFYWAGWSLSGHPGDLSSLGMSPVGLDDADRQDETPSTEESGWFAGRHVAPVVSGVVLFMVAGGIILIWLRLRHRTAECPPNCRRDGE